MKLSEKTITILKNFSTINQSIHIDEGNVISTMSPQRTILASAFVEEIFPTEFRIYDLNRFLSVLGLVEDGDMTFTDTAVRLKNGTTEATYNFCAPGVIEKPKKSSLDMSDSEIEFVMTPEIIKDVMQAARIYQLPQVAVVGDGEKMTFTAVDSKNISSDTFSVNLGETDLTFKMVFNVDNIKLLPLKYDVKIASKGMANFVSGDIQYFIATEREHNKYGDA